MGKISRLYNFIAGTKALAAQVNAELSQLVSANNTMDDAVTGNYNTLSAAITAGDTARYTKVETDTLVATQTNNLLASITFDANTGVFTVTEKDGTVYTINTALEKVPATFELVTVGQYVYLRITNVDGTYTQTDVTSLMNVYTFSNTSTIAFTQTGTGNEKTVTATIRDASVTLAMLSLDAITAINSAVSSCQQDASSATASAQAAATSASNSNSYALQAQASSEASGIQAGTATTKASEASTSAGVATSKATLSQSYAVGGTGTRVGEDTDNAKYYKEQAAAIVGGDWATKAEVAVKADITYVDSQLKGQLEQTSVTWYWSTTTGQNDLTTALPVSNLQTTFVMSASATDYTQRFRFVPPEAGLWSPKSTYKLYFPITGFQSNTNYTVKLKYYSLTTLLREVTVTKTGAQLESAGGIVQDLNVLVRNTSLAYGVTDYAYLDVIISRSNGTNHTLTGLSTTINPMTYTRTSGAVDTSNVYELVGGVAKTQATLNAEVQARLSTIPTVTITGATQVSQVLAGKNYLCNSASQIDIAIVTDATSAVADGTVITFTRLGAGAVKFTGTGITLYSAGSKSNIRAQYEQVVLQKLSTNTWLLTGALA